MCQRKNLITSVDKHLLSKQLIFSALMTQLWLSLALECDSSFDSIRLEMRTSLCLWEGTACFAMQRACWSPTAAVDETVSSRQVHEIIVSFSVDKAVSLPEVTGTVNSPTHLLSMLSRYPAPRITHIIRLWHNYFNMQARIVSHHWSDHVKDSSYIRKVTT